MSCAIDFKKVRSHSLQSQWIELDLVKPHPKTDGGQGCLTRFDDREYSTEMVFLLGLAPCTLG